VSRTFLAGCAASVLLAAVLPAAETGKITAETISFRGKTRTYSLFVPSGAPEGAKLPAIVTLHGSGGKGERIVSRWIDQAQKEKVILIGPDSLDAIHWVTPADGPLLLHEIVEKVAEKHPIDGRRVYLFGHSAGAVWALQMGALESEYFAAAVISAGSLQPGFFKIFDYATRKIPYFLIIGTLDQYFSLEEVAGTRAALKARGFPVEFWEIAGHDHAYSARSKDINAKAWDFFQRNPLPSEPRYTVYQDPNGSDR
jgi:poly(3-hydroxybutyrate) depolymerase